MARNIYMSGTKQPKERLGVGKLFLRALLLSLIGIFLTLRITEGSDFTSLLSFVFGPKEYVIYDTYTLSFDESMPSGYVQVVTENLDKLEFNGKKRFEIKEGSADINLSRDVEEGGEEIFSKDLIPVGHMYSLVNEINVDTLSNYNLFVLDSMDKEFLENDYGEESLVLETYDELVAKLKEDDNNIGLVSFDTLDYRVKVLEVGDAYYLEDREGAISISFYANVDDKVDDFILSVFTRNIGVGGQSWDQDKLAKINMGGVVAIARALALKMDTLGDYEYPAREIGPFLADADLTHVSNEVSFVPGCDVYSGLRFCSKPEYIKVLEKSGVDIVELTGNHNNDFGSEYSADTIKVYKDVGMRYFGGGLNKEDASKILYEEVNGSKIAFVGYNYYDTIYPSLALAGEERSGANSYSEEKLRGDIQEAKELSDVVIVTFQFQECYSYPPSDVIYPICYKPLSNPDQRAVFRQAVDFGADIVVGTQAHQPQTYELYGEGVIFYGLGNLFFDQGIWIGTRQGLVLSHYVYEGKLLQSKLTPIYMEKDLMPRLATEEQGDLLLELLKDAR